MQEVTDVESRTNLPENHATQPAKAQLETQLEKAQQSVLIHLHQEQAHLQEELQQEEASEPAKALREALQQEEASQQAEALLQAETLREALQQEEASELAKALREELQQEEASQQAENLTARTASSLRTGRKKPPKPLLPLKQQKMEYV